MIGAIGGGSDKSSLDGLLALVADPKATKAKLAEIQGQIAALNAARDESSNAAADLYKARQAHEELVASSTAGLDDLEVQLVKAQGQLTADRKALDRDRAAVAKATAKLEALNAAADDRTVKLAARDAELIAQGEDLDREQRNAKAEADKAEAAGAKLEAALAELADWRDAMAQTMPALKKLLAARK